MRRFDAADDHDTDGYATTAAWLAAKTRLGRKDAGDLTQECLAALAAVIEALGKSRGPQDLRTAPQRYHDARQEACTPQPRVCPAQPLSYSRVRHWPANSGHP